MAPLRTLVIILAGGAGGRLKLLTHERAKPAVPFAGTHRLIDFPLSNCQNAGIADVWVAQQFNPASLSDHLANGRPWDLDRTDGGLLVLQPRLGHDERTGFGHGTADSLWRNAPLIREFAPDVLIVVSADAVYKLDYAALAQEHLEADADLTIVTTEVELADAGRYGVVGVDDGRVREYAYKPEEPKGSLVANEVFAFSPGPVLDTLDELGDDAGDDGLDDLGDDLLPRLVDAGPRASTGCPASGATSGRCRRTGTAIRSCWGRSGRSTSTTRSGRSARAASPTARRSACCAARRSRTACSRPRRPWPATSSARW